MANGIPEGYELVDEFYEPPKNAAERVQRAIKNTASEVKEFQVPKQYEVVEAPAAVTEMPEETLPAGTIGDAIGEPLLSMASNLGGMAASGVTQLATAPFTSKEEAAQLGSDIQTAASEFGAPQTQMGQDALGAIGSAGQFIADEFNQAAGGLADLTFGGGDEIREKGLFPTLGQGMLDLTGSPMAATATEMIPELIPGLYAGKQIINNRGAQTLPKQQIANRLLDRDTAGDLAPYKLDSKGRAVPDLTAQDAIDAGFSPTFIQELKSLPPAEGVGNLINAPRMNATQQKALEMIDIKRKGANDKVYADRNRPTDVVGDSGLERLNYIKDVNRKAGKAIDKEATKLKDQEIDFSQPVSNFKQGLDDMGVKFNDKTLEYDFKGSDIEGLSGLENVVNRVIKRMSSGEPGEMPSAYDVHRLKRYLDKNIGYGKNIEGLDADVEHLLRQLRVDLDDTLDNKFPAYDKANTAYAETIDLIKEMKSLAGTKVDLTGESANRAMGQTLRKALTNYQAGSRVKQVISDMDQVSRKYGGEFNDDINMLISLDNQMDQVLGASASGGFQAGIGAGVREGLMDVLPKSNRRKMADWAIDKITPEKADAFDVLERAVRGGENPWRSK